MRVRVPVRVGGAVAMVSMDVKACSVCRRRPHARDCDGMAPHRPSGTCDARLCNECRTVVPRAGAEDMDLCPDCAKDYILDVAQPPRRRGLFHVEVPQPWPWALCSAGAPCMFPRVDVAEGKRRHAPAPEGLVGSWLALWAPEGYDAESAAWMRSALGLHVPGPLQVPQGAYVALAELGACTTICNDGRAFREPWWGGTGRTWGAFAWWVEACPVEPLPMPWASTTKHLQSLTAQTVNELRRRYDATVSGRWWPPRYAPSPQAPLHDDSPVPPMLEHPEQGHLL